MILLGGDSEDAGFVQLIQGRVRDRERAHALAEQTGETISKYRPDVIGATTECRVPTWVTPPAEPVGEGNTGPSTVARER